MQINIRDIKRWMLLLCIVTLCSTAQALSPLQLTTSSPTNNADDGLRTGTIASLNFSTALNPTTVSTNHIMLRSATTMESIAVSATGNVLQVTSNHELLPATTYTLSVTGVQGSNGELLSSPISITFRTRDAAWQNAQQLQNNVEFVNASHLAMNKADGTAMAIWSQQTGASKWSLWASRYDGQQWDIAQPVSNDPAGEVLESAVAVGPNGTAVAAWQEFYINGFNNNSNVHFRIWASVFTPASGWATAQLIDSEDAQYSMSPQVAVSADGKATVVWSQDNGSAPRNSPSQFIGRIFSNQYVPGNGWGTPTVLDAFSKDGSLDPYVAFDDNNFGYAVWEQFWHNAVIVWANRYTPNHGWTAPQIIQSNKAISSSGVKLAFDGRGNAIAVWIQEPRTLVTSRYIRDQGWLAPVEVNSGSYSSRATFQITEPSIAINKNGDAFVVWSELAPAATNSNGITALRSIPWSMRYTIKNGWESPVLLESPTAFICKFTNPVSIAMDDAGNALAAWSGNNGTFRRIYTNRYQVGKGWVGRKVIDTFDTTGAFNPNIGIDSNGNGLALWEQLNSAGFATTIWTNQFK